MLLLMEIFLVDETGARLLLMTMLLPHDELYGTLICEFGWRNTIRTKSQIFSLTKLSDPPMPRSMLISRLVIPTIITPPGIVSILALSVLSEGNARLLLQILILFLAIMLLNLLTMLRARALMGFLTTAGLRMIGWLFAVFQASFGAQIIINSLRRLGALPV